MGATLLPKIKANFFWNKNPAWSNHVEMETLFFQHGLSPTLALPQPG